MDCVKLNTEQHTRECDYKNSKRLARPNLLIYLLENNLFALKKGIKA